jgi:cytochrome c553
MTIRRTALLPAAVTAALLLLPVMAARADTIEEKAAVCSGCHGENGVPVDKSIPVIWGQNEGYLYLELRDYKLGNRKNEIMGQVAGGLEKQDMKDLAAYFTAKPWPNLQQPRAAADLAHRAEVIDGSAACKGCHLAQWQGDSVTPHLAGQEQQYLRDTMAAFRSGERANNPWMTALLKTFSDSDIDALAAYLAGY